MTAIDGSVVAVNAQTVCLHGDGAHALEFAQQLNQALRAAGVQLAAGTTGRAQ